MEYVDRLSTWSFGYCRMSCPDFWPTTNLHAELIAAVRSYNRLVGFASSFDHVHSYRCFDEWYHLFSRKLCLDEKMFWGVFRPTVFAVIMFCVKCIDNYSQGNYRGTYNSRNALCSYYYWNGYVGTGNCKPVVRVIWDTVLFTKLFRFRDCLVFETVLFLRLPHFWDCFTLRQTDLTPEVLSRIPPFYDVSKILK